MRITHLILTLLAIIGASSCSKKPSASVSAVSTAGSDSLPAQVNMLIRAVAADDSAAFASMVMYPLERPYPLHDISSAAEMKAYYSTMVDDSLRSVITLATPSNWQEYGWRGWSPANGAYIWVDDSVYAVPHLSQAENRLRDKLVEREMASLATFLQPGWTPVGCLTGDDGSVYRIDRSIKDEHPVTYRLAVYSSREGMRSHPAAVMTGYREVEGSMGITSYNFSAPDGSTAFYQADSPDGSDPVIDFKAANGPARSITVAPAYWLDILP